MPESTTDTKLWGGRFAGGMDALMARFNASLPFDWRLWDADIAGSVAWARAIAAAGLLTADERDRIVVGPGGLAGGDCSRSGSGALPARPTRTSTATSSAG